MMCDGIAEAAYQQTARWSVGSLTDATLSVRQKNPDRLRGKAARLSGL
jgi:hypothetical protein